MRVPSGLYGKVDYVKKLKGKYKQIPDFSNCSNKKGQVENTDFKVN